MTFDPDCDCYNCQLLEMESYWDEMPDPDHEFLTNYPEDGYIDASYEDYYADASMAYTD